jgi:ribosomal protection tetracycline resistance protein
MPTAADFRGLTPLVLRRALERAGTVICEPVSHLRLELPADALGPVLAAATRLGATLAAPDLAGPSAVVEGELASIRVADLQRQLPGLTRGEGVVEASFAGFRPVS